MKGFTEQEQLLNVVKGLWFINVGKNESGYFELFFPGIIHINRRPDFGLIYQ